MPFYKRDGWDWLAFSFGPFWYFVKGMYTKGFWLLVILVFSCLLSLPFICVYCGSKGRHDLYNFELKNKSKINLNGL